MIQNQAVSDDGKVMSKDEIGHLKRELFLKNDVYFNSKKGKPDIDGESFCKECVDEGRGKQLTEYSEEREQYQCTKCPAFVRITKIKNPILLAVA
jgi:hypothetical protein